MDSGLAEAKTGKLGKRQWPLCSHEVVRAKLAEQNCKWKWRKGRS